MFTYGPDLSSPGEPAEAAEIAAHAVGLEKESIFLQGLSERLNALGFACAPDDTGLMLEEIRRRYKTILGINCPRTVVEWVRGTIPGISNRRNNYELCFALEMDFEQTADFFRRYFLTLPWGCKSRTDAIFLYCIYHRKPYSEAARMLDGSQSFVPQENAHTATAQIFQTIISTDDDAAFLEYLSAHCYGNEQQFMTARAKIIEETERVKERLRKDISKEIVSKNRLNSNVIAELLSYKYQEDTEGRFVFDLPDRYTSSLPNDVTLGKILNGSTASYETLRKTLMLLHFSNFYSEASNMDAEEIESNFLDFYEELDEQLELCGFSPIYLGHPFDYILLSCANTLDPIVTFYEINDRN